MSMFSLFLSGKLSIRLGNNVYKVQHIHELNHIVNTLYKNVTWNAA